jgi:hypothetical protein
MNGLLRAALAGALVVAVVGASRADTVHFIDRATKKEKTYVGTIQEESLAGIKIKLRSGKNPPVMTVPPGDVTYVVYETKDVDAVSYRAPFRKEDRARLEANPKKRVPLYLAAIDGFRTLEGQLRGRPAARRYMQYKIAEVTVQLAKDDPTKKDEAIKLLAEYKKDNPAGWQILSVLKTLAKLQEDAGRTDDARKTYEELAEVPGVPAELKQESEILVGRLLLRGGKYNDAEARLKKLADTLSAGDAQKPFVDAYLAESRISQGNPASVEKQLQDLVRNNTDARLRGVVFNLLGDHYRKRNELDKAFWSYLRVDAMYNDDAEEQAKALYHLATLFDKKKNDRVRAKECAARLKTPRYDGTLYQKLAGGEAKK